MVSIIIEYKIPWEEIKEFILIGGNHIRFSVTVEM